MRTTNQTSPKILKFRAWNTTDKVMVFVTNLLWQLNWSDNPPITVSNTPTFISGKIPPTDKFRETEKTVLGDLLDFIIMQFTGLKDKNGKEIYEGDIITYPILGKDEPIKREVKFYNGAFGVFTGNGTRYPTGGATTEFGLLGNGLVHEVIGNKFENPELLVPTPSK